MEENALSHTLNPLDALEEHKDKKQSGTKIHPITLKYVYLQVHVHMGVHACIRVH